jgi:adenosylmethionine-8-amino-7-oxononanoate aminotransferase
MLRELRAWCDRVGTFLIADEVMTGFGRTGTLFACEREGVVPDFVALAKGITGGYLPLAATLTTRRVFEGFLGGGERTFFYGHSYTGNALACAVALESLAIFREEGVMERLQTQIAWMGELLERELKGLPWVYEVRQCGLVAGIELREPGGGRFGPERGVGKAVCLEARRHGLLTRPIRDTVVLMPPYCISACDLERAVGAIARSVQGVLGGGAGDGIGARN